MTRGRRAVAFVLAPLCFLVTVSVARPSRAGDPAAAQAPFTEGRKLMAARNYTAACPKLEESQRLDAGIGTQFNLADCYEHVGRTASAWAQFLEVAAAAKSARQRARESSARIRASQLEPRLSRLVVAVDASRAPAGLVVKRDDVDVGSAQWGTPLPVDPGAHAIVATAPGKVRWETRVTVGERADRVTTTVPVLEDAPPEAAPAVADSAVEGPSPRAARRFETPSRSPAADRQSAPPGRTQRIVGLVAGGVGLVGLGVGSAYGLMSKSKRDTSNAGHCDARGQCDATGLSLRDDAIHAGTISTVGFIAGGVALAIGILLYVTAPSDSGPSASAMHSWWTVPARAMGGTELW